MCLVVISDDIRGEHTQTWLTFNTFLTLVNILRGWVGERI